MKKLLKSYKGFTLIELLIVIAIIGVLAAVVLVAIDPLEQLARSRDSGRQSSITQLGNAISANYTGAQQGQQYLAQATTWETDLQTAGEIKTIPVNAGGAGYTVGCNTATAVDATGKYCYRTATVGTSPEAVVYARAESKSLRARANTGGTACPSTNTVWIVWTSAQGKTGLECLAAGVDPGPGDSVN